MRLQTWSHVQVEEALMLYVIIIKQNVPFVEEVSMIAVLVLWLHIGSHFLYYSRRR